MKYFKMIFGILAMLAVFAVMPETASAAKETVGSYEYDVSNGTASISKYNGTEANVVVPTEVTIKGVRYKISKINRRAYEGNATMTTLVIPKGISTIGSGAFRNCTSLTSITINGDIADCDSGATDVRGREGAFYNVGTNADSLTVTFAEGVTKVPAYLFATPVEANNMHAKVTKVTFANTVTEVGTGAFHHCADMAEVELGGARKIGEGAFAECGSLKKIAFSTGLTSIGKNAFHNCDALAELTLPSSLTTIEESAFAECDILKKVEFPSKLTTIGRSAFESCVALETISLPKSDCAIGRSAFKNCTALSAITVNGNIADCDPGSVGETSAYWNRAVFYNAGANADALTVTFAQGVTRVPAYLFGTYADTTNMHARVTKVVLSDTVSEIGANAFYHCINLAEIELKNVKAIGKEAFGHCYSLKNLVFPSELSTIGERVFDNCTALESISLPKTDCSIGNCAFRNCTALASIIVNGNIADCDHYSIAPIIDPAKRCRDYSVFYNAGANANSLSVTFAEGVTRVPAYLFATHVDASDMTYARVTNVTLSGTISEIGAYAFYNCAALTNMTIPDSGTLGGIGDYAFYNCSALKEMMIPDSVEVIGENIATQCAPGFTIRLFDNSAIHKYAVENEYNYTLIDWNGWRTRKGNMFWFENGVIQGREGRGKEIYDPDSDAWYWLDAVQDGAKAVSKDVYQESSGGKWVRYDAAGHMIKGWQTTDAGRYYFDLITGAMYKGLHNIDGTDYYFNETTGIEGAMYPDGWNEIDGVSYWYENGVRQGYDPENPDYRGKEIYDPSSDAWYWLDNVQQGAKAVSKDVYQESISAYPDREDGTGKWVRYDAVGHMIKGWQTTDAGTYYFEPVTGAMAKGQVIIDGDTYYFDPATGIRQ